MLGQFRERRFRQLGRDADLRAHQIHDVVLQRKAEEHGRLGRGQLIVAFKPADQAARGLLKRLIDEGSFSAPCPGTQRRLGQTSWDR